MAPGLNGRNMSARRNFFEISLDNALGQLHSSNKRPERAKHACNRIHATLLPIHTQKAPFVLRFQRSCFVGSLFLGRCPTLYCRALSAHNIPQS